MTSDSSTTPTLVQDAATAPQVRFKRKDGRLLLLLPPEDKTAADWNEVWQQLKQRLAAAERFWEANTPVHLMAGDRLLDTRQLQSIADSLSQEKLLLKRVYTSRRQTAVAAATAGYSVEQHESVAHLSSKTKADQGASPVDALYVETTVRSGVEVRHTGSVIVLGDVNPGGTVVADGDVIVWGTLRGVAQAGAAGNRKCRIMALRMEATQLRIADAVARSPETPPDEYCPEVAHATASGIRIVRAQDFSRLSRSS
ncbi:MAG: septum site-determining protein MinC [Cyanobacteria bacterium P01_A01_bin.135]